MMLLISRKFTLSQQMSLHPLNTIGLQHNTSVGGNSSGRKNTTQLDTRIMSRMGSAGSRGVCTEYAYGVQSKRSHGTGQQNQRNKAIEAIVKYTPSRTGSWHALKGIHISVLPCCPIGEAAKPKPPQPTRRGSTFLTNSGEWAAWAPIPVLSAVPVFAHSRLLQLSVLQFFSPLSFLVSS